MTKRKKVILVLSAALLVALVVCTVASQLIYISLLPAVHVAAVESGDVYETVSAEGIVTRTESGVRVVCTLTGEDIEKIAESQHAEFYWNDKKAIGAVTRIQNDGSTVVAELTLPYAFSDAANGETLEVHIRLNGGRFDCVIPASSLYTDGSGAYVYVLKFGAGLFGEELQVSRLDVQNILFTNDQYTAVEFYSYMEIPEHVVSYSTQPLESGMAVKKFVEK